MAVMKFANLPRELLDAIEGYLDDDDCRILCQTCRGFMSAMQTRAYRHITLDESSESGRSFLATAAGPRAQYVRHFRYSPHDPMPVKGWDEEQPRRENEHDPDIKLSDEAREALGSLHLLRGLEEVAVALHHWHLDGWPMTPFAFQSYAFKDYYDDCDVEPWRILLEESFLALSSNSTRFSRLIFDNIPPIPPAYNAFHTGQWKALLSQLTSFEIVLARIPDQGAGSITPAHQEFLCSLFNAFLPHLVSTRRLRIAGDEDAAVGHYDNDDPITWGPASLPQLEIFELEYASLAEGIVSFLGQHCHTLEKVYLRHCFTRDMADWRDLIQAFVTAQPTQLLEFTIVPDPDLESRSSSPNSIDHREAEERAREARKLRLFQLAETCESYGAIQSVDDWRREHGDVLEGLDVAELWEVLQELIRNNRAGMGIS